VGASQSVSKFKDAIAAASKRGKKTKKKAVRKRANKKAPDRRMPPSTLPTEVNHKVGALASDVELRQFVRLWARCGWDSHQAVAKLHPELRPNEIAAVVINYRNSRHIKAALQDVLHEVSESSTMTQIEAETILTSHASRRYWISSTMMVKCCQSLPCESFHGGHSCRSRSFA